jgi:O-antigen ligase
MPKNTEEWILRILQGTLLLTFFMPLVLVSKSFIFPFIVPKILVFRSLVILGFGLYTLLLVSNWKKYKVKMSIMHYIVFGFALSFFVSTFVGVDWYKSLWDNHERMLGFFTVFHYILLYILLAKTVRGMKEWTWFFRIFLLAGSVVMFIGFLQKINPELLLNRGNGRVSATLGNAIYFSGYGLFLFFVGMYLFIKEKNIYFKYSAVVLGILGMLGIFWGGTRGTILGLIAMIGVCVLLYGLFSTQKNIKRISQGALILGVMMIGLLGVFKQTTFVQSIPGIGRLVKTDIFAGSAETRLMAWEVAVEGWKERPVFGWGPNNYYYLFNKHYNPKFLEHGWGETWFDNAHSAIFNTLAVQGIIGLLLYFALFGCPIFVLYRAYKKESIDIHTFVLPSSFLIGHFVHNAFVFENPTSYLYFFFVLAFIVSIVKGKEENNEDSEKLSAGIIIFISLAVLFFIWVFNINAANANKTALKSLQNMYALKGNSIELQQTIAMPSPHRDDIRNDFSRTLIELIPHYEKAGRKKEIIELLQFAEGELYKNIELHPADVRVYFLGFELQKNLLALTGNQEYIFKAEKLLDIALEYSPDRQQFLYNAAFIKVKLNKVDEGFALLQHAVDGNKQIAESWWRLASLYSMVGEKDKAKELILEAQSIVEKISDKDQKIFDDMLKNN